MGVVRNRLGALEDQFFATVFFGRGLLFVACVFAPRAATGAFVAAIEVGNIQPANEEVYYFVRWFSGLILLKKTPVPPTRTLDSHWDQHRHARDYLVEVLHSPTYSSCHST